MPITLRDATWLDKVYGEWKGFNEKTLTYVEDDSDDESDNTKIMSNTSTGTPQAQGTQGVLPQQQQVQQAGPTTQQARELRKLTGFYNTTANQGTVVTGGRVTRYMAARQNGREYSDK